MAVEEMVKEKLSKFDDRYEKLRKNVPAFKDTRLLQANCPGIYAGYVDTMVAFTIAQHEDPKELDNRMVTALVDAKKMLDDSLKKLRANIKGI
jgi:hypothetical protein